MAIADNVKKGKFARGGSTISMQLVKNVFLSRKKTIARKIEEAIIVWMIEHKRLTSKERMYEVYLNIIEWGPGIYGIAEASQFYFSKKPADLTIEESIFLASIIPRPKGFKWSFDENGNLKSYLESYFRRMAELMTRREVITEEQKAAVVANVKLTGPAKNFVITSDSTDMDDSEDEDLFGEEEDDKRFFFFRKKKSEDKGELKEKKSSRKNESAVKVEENKSEEKTEKKKKKWSLFK
jgi:membrane peptidoglycan carboxypeptidase